MAIDYEVPADKRLLYWLGDKLIDYRHPVSILVLIITGLFAYWSFQLQLVTSFGELLPQTHPYVQIHNKYSKDFGGANNIVMMMEVEEGHLFNVENLAQIYLMTEEIDKVYGVNHNQIDSIGHRTTRHLRVAAAGTLRSEPIMVDLPRNETEAADIRRIVHSSENVFGILVSLDDRAAIIRANFIEGRLDYRRIFDEMNERVIRPFTDGWIGAALEEVDPDRAEAFGVEKGKGILVARLFPDSVAAAAGLKQDDVITKVNGKEVVKRWEVSNAVAAKDPAGVQIEYLRDGKPGNLVLQGGGSDIKLWVAGEPRLYGWVYSYAGDVFFILVITYCIEWVLRWMYFHDWRGALRPTITGLIAAFWGLGFIYLIGLALDPLMLVMPFLITARAVSHAIQMHDRYYEEFEKCGWNKRRAIVASFAELFVPTFSGVVTDAIGVLVILLVPVLMLQKLALTASWWILAITVSEMLLNPIVYYYLKAPEPELVMLRERGAFRYYTERFVDKLLTPMGRRVTIIGWVVVMAVAGYNLQGLQIGDPGSASPLLFEDSPYNRSHGAIQGKFGGVEPLIIVAEGYDKNAMKDPHTLKTMESFQRYLERDPSVGYSFSLSDILRAVNSVFHELEPKWGVIPGNWVDIGGLFFIFFSGSPPTETAKYVSTDYSTAHVTFFCRDHKGSNIRRVIGRSKEFITNAQLEDMGIEVAEENEQVVVKGELDAPSWIKAGSTWQGSRLVLGEKKEGPFKPGDKIVAIGDHEVTDFHSLEDALQAETSQSKSLSVKVDRGGQTVEAMVAPPWKAQFKLAGGLIGVLAAANEELVRNDLLMNFLGFFTIWIILLFTYRSFRCGLYLLAPMVCSNVICNAVMSLQGTGINIHTLPLVTVGVGFGVDYGMYMVSRIIEEIRIRNDIVDSTREALITTGKAITFTAVTMVVSTAFWISSEIRFNAEMGLLLAIWMGIGYLGAQTLLPVLLVTMKPAFIMREAGKPPESVAAIK
ncbi:MAG TPA: MMPL family transporter [Candidatus Limnocylindrales bacterium]|nr:MMPL family transporter [Candidatus Limnocylindrales bacterium]